MPKLQYSQTSGEMIYISDTSAVIPIGTGYAGNRAGKNNPDMEDVRCVGPLPRGEYHIGTPLTHPHLGPFAMHLEPKEGTEMHGRDGFWIHGGSSGNNKGQESEGCIILQHQDREDLWATGCRELEVVR